MLTDDISRRQRTAPRSLLERSVANYPVNTYKYRNRFSPSMANMICPYCEQPVGVEGNRFQFELVNFSIEDSSQGKKKKKKEEPMVRSICAIYCENCNKVLGLTP